MLAFRSPTRAAWMGVRAALTAAIAALAAQVIVPAGRAAPTGAEALDRGTGDVQSI